MDEYEGLIVDKRYLSNVHQSMGIYDVNIYRKQVEEDIDVLEYILNNIYSGKDYLKKRGVNVSKCLEEVKKKLQPMECLNKAAFFEMICEALREVKDGHLTFNLPYFNKEHRFCAHNTVYFADLLLKEENGKYIVEYSGDQQVQYGDVIDAENENIFKMVNEQWLYGVFSEKPLEKTYCVCNGKKVQVKIYPVQGEQVSGSDLWSYNRIKDIDIIVIRCLSAFDSEEEEEVRQLIEIGKKLRDSSKIIIDLRGNSGGYFEYARQFIENINGMAAVNMNYAKLDSQGSRLAELSLCAKSFEEYEKAQKDCLLNSTAMWHCSEKQAVCKGDYKKELVILTDKNTASSAEIMVKCLKESIPQSIIIGENTKGMLNTGDTRYYYLPYSMIFLSVPTAIFANVFEEGTGFLPDFWSKDDALQAAIEFLS